MVILINVNNYNRKMNFELPQTSQIQPNLYHVKQPSAPAQ